MKKYRYPGYPPFSFEDRKLFYGRDDDIDRVFKYMNVENLVVLHSKSGLGKSSMLNAGIVPKLLEETNFQPFTIKFSSYQKTDAVSPVEVVVSEITKGISQKTFLDQIAKPDGSLWYHLKSQQIVNNGEKDFFLILDQFENLFSFLSKKYNEFGRQLADLLNVTIPQNYRDSPENELNKNPGFLTAKELKLLYKPFKVHVVIAIREDKMALLNRLKNFLPDILNKTIVINPLSRDQAEDAITYPAYIKDKDLISQPFDYSDDALKKMLDYLTLKDKEKGDESILSQKKDEDNGIESFQLQILCQYIEDKIVIGKKKKFVEANDIGNIEDIFSNYYGDIIKELPASEQYAARLLIEEGLIFEEDMRRESLHETRILKTYAISGDTLRELVNRRLLRTEPHAAGGFTYELSHDTLVAPIIKEKAKRVKAEGEEKVRKEERDKAEAERIEAERLEAERIEAARIKAERLKAERAVVEGQQKRRILSIIITAYVVLITIAGVWLFKGNAEIKLKNAEILEQQDLLRQKNDSLNETRLLQENLNKLLTNKNDSLTKFHEIISAKNLQLEKNAEDLS